MAEPLKDSFGPDVAVRIAEMIESTFPEFGRAAFLALALDGFEDLELTPRARQIADALAGCLPDDRETAVGLLTRSLGPEIGESDLTGLASMLYLPFGYFIAEHGLECFDASMLAQYELTKRFTAEFSIRAFLERHPAETLRVLSGWAHDPNVHVRRLVSEGTRPRLPWAPRLKEFQQDPTPVLALLEQLKDDPEEYVRRSVANNLNDISKDHPVRVVEVAARWSVGASRERLKLIRHGLRTLIKAGDLGALAVLGYDAPSPLEIRSVTCAPATTAIGGSVRIEVEVFNPLDATVRALVDLRVHFVKSRGSTSPKVFKGADLTLTSAQSRTIRKTISLAQHSTRKHYPGRHQVEVILNGITGPGATFDLKAS